MSLREGGLKGGLEEGWTQFSVKGSLVSDLVEEQGTLPTFLP